MAKNTISFFEIIPRTDNPQQEAIDYTNNFKDCIQGITSPQFIPNRFFVDYLDVILPEPRVPSEHSAQSKAKSINELYFWSSWLPWLKWKITGNDLDYKQYLEKKRKMEADADLIYQNERKWYENELKRVNEARTEKVTEFKNYDIRLIEDYFSYVLEYDQFSINFFDAYDIGVDSLQYDEESRTLLVHYRIPAFDEIVPLDYFYYDEESRLIKDRQLTSGIAVDYRNDIAHRVLLRAAASLYQSDKENMIDIVELYGYLDDHSTDGRTITVLRLRIPRDEIVGKYAEFVNTRRNFTEKFQEERSLGLYKLEPYQLRELLSKTRLPNKDPHTTTTSRSKRSKR